MLKHWEYEALFAVLTGSAGHALSTIQLCSQITSGSSVTLLCAPHMEHANPVVLVTTLLSRQKLYRRTAPAS